MRSEQLRAKLAGMAKLTTWAQVGRDLGFPPSFLHDVVNGRRGVSEKLAKALGYEQVVSYRKIKETV